jgi:serine/threonine-protein kinase
MSLSTVDGRYQVTARIASGGMGEVYRAHDAVLAREVAIKVLHQTLAGDAGFIDRFRREARSAALLSHPNIVAVHDWGSTDGTYFMVMEYIRGRNLRDLLTANGRLEPAQVADVLLQVLAALEHAHRRGIVHRDVKPENVLVTGDGTVKVADFGLARALAESRITQAPGTVTGTVQYLAPEQIQGDPADPRTDLYALGVVGYELLTGQVPFMGETSLAIAYKHLTDRVPAPSAAEPSVSPELDRVVLAATEKRRDHRPSSAAELRDSVLEVASELAPAPPIAELVRGMPDQDEAGPEERAATVTIPRVLAPRARRRRQARRGLAFLVLIGVVVGAAWVGWVYLVPHYTRVPQTLGLSQAAAVERLEAAGLEWEFGPPVRSVDFAEGEVASQSVEAGERARTGTQVVIRLSSGLPLREVPVLRDKTRRQVVTILGNADLELGEVTEGYHEQIPVGRVISQSPEAGTTLQHGSPVDVVLSLGPQPIEVPKVTGLTEEQASAVLLSAGLGVAVQEEYSDSVPRGQVVRQQPGPRTGVERESTVTIWVSLGPQEFDMPSVIGEPTDGARARLEGLGLRVEVITLPGQGGGRVVFQDPAAGSTVRRGDAVTIYDE